MADADFSFFISPINSPACILHWRVLVHLNLKLSPSLRAAFFSWGSPLSVPVSSASVAVPPLISAGSVPSFAQVAAPSQSAPPSSLLPVSSASDATSTPVSAFPPLISAGSVPSSVQVAAASRSAPPSDQSDLLPRSAYFSVSFHETDYSYFYDACTSGTYFSSYPSAFSSTSGSTFSSSFHCHFCSFVSITRFSGTSASV